MRLWASFAAGSSLGGALTGLGLALAAGLLSWLPATIRTGVLIVVVVALVVLDLVQARLRLPQRNKLIPQEVFADGLLIGIARFGIEYGSGVRTLIPSAASYIAASYLLLTNLDWWQTVALGAVFGFSRTLAIAQYLLLGRPGWSDFLARHTRVLERLGSVLTAALVIVLALA